MSVLDSPETIWGQLFCGNKANSLINISKRRFTIGRAKDCDLRLKSRLVSGHHCHLVKDDEGNVILYDTSTNGTMLNKTKWITNGKCHKLENGDEFFLVFKKDSPNNNISLVFYKLENDTSRLDDTEDWKSSDTDVLNTSDIKAMENIVDDQKCEPSSKKFKSSSEADVSLNMGSTDRTEATSSNLSIRRDESVDSAKTPCDGEDAMEQMLLCSICQDILYDCICLQPCMHSFCGGCYAPWMKKSNECPTCRLKVLRICKNHIVNNLVEAYLLKYPEKRRSDSDVRELDSKNTITHDMLYPKKHLKGFKCVEDFDSESGTSDSDAYSENSCNCDSCRGLSQGNASSPASFPVQFNYRCQQCPGVPEIVTVKTVNAASQIDEKNSSSALNNSPNTTSPEPGTSGNSSISSFVCKPLQVHCLCHCCSIPMPDRRNDRIVQPDIPPQNCSHCYRLFCHMYWICKKPGCYGCLNTFQNINFGDKCLIGLINENSFESQVLKDYLISENKTWRDVLAHCLEKLDLGEYSCSSVIRKDSVLCYSCALAHFRELAYQYRKDIPQDKLPADVVSRPDCYWGRNCRTQKNRLHHARNFNHICEQIRFQ